MGQFITTQVKRETQFRNLSQYQVYIEDESDVSTNFLNISQFPEEFSLGKNAFLIRGSEKLVGSSPILIEILDVEGNVIYHETNDYKEDVARLVSVYVYEDTPAGPCEINIMTEASEDVAGKTVPSEWEGKYNFRWSRSLNVNPNIYNETKVRFFKPPELTSDSLTLRDLEFTFDEAGEPDTNTRRQIINGDSTDGPKISGRINPVVYGYSNSLVQVEPTSASENSCGETLSNSFNFLRGMEDGTIRVTELSDNTNLDARDSEDLTVDADNPIELRITRVLNEKKCYVRPINEFEDYTEQIMLQCNGDFTLEYTRLDPVTVTVSNEVCFVALQLKNLKTMAGAVLRSRVYAKEFETDNPFSFIGDFELDPQELLIDLDDAQTPRNKRTGVFLDQTDIDDFLNPLNSESVLDHNNTDLLNSVNVLRDDGSGTEENIDPVEENQISFNIDDSSEDCKSEQIVGGDVNYAADTSGGSIPEDANSNTADKKLIGFEYPLFQSFPNLNFEVDVEYTLSFRTLLNNLGDQVDDTKFSVFISYKDEDGNERQELLETIEIENGKFGYKDVKIDFKPNRNGDGSSKLIVKIRNGNWFFSDFSLIPSQDEGFSPDFTTLYFPLNSSDLTQIGTNLTFKVDLFDLNNNRVPVNLQTAGGLDLSGCGQIS